MVLPCEKRPFHFQLFISNFLPYLQINFNNFHYFYFQYLVGPSVAATAPVSSTAVTSTSGTLAQVGASHAASAAATGSPTAAVGPFTRSVGNSRGPFSPALSCILPYRLPGRRRAGFPAGGLTTPVTLTSSIPFSADNRHVDTASCNCRQNK